VDREHLAVGIEDLDVAALAQERGVEVGAQREVVALGAARVRVAAGEVDREVGEVAGGAAGSALVRICRASGSGLKL
jgi:hypothetical protein